MKQNNLPTFNIPKKLLKEITMFCELNKIDNIDDMMLGFIKGGFAIEKFGRTPVKAGKEIKPDESDRSEDGKKEFKIFRD